jgi:hypothetical protein
VDVALTERLMLSEIPLSRLGDRWDGSDLSADNTGVVSFARLYDGDGVAVLDLPRENLGLNTPHICAGYQISMSMQLNPMLNLLLT